MGIGFVWYVITYNFHVRNLLTFQNLISTDEIYRLGAFDIFVPVA